MTFFNTDNNYFGDFDESYGLFPELGTIDSLELRTSQDSNLQSIIHNIEQAIALFENRHLFKYSITTTEIQTQIESCNLLEMGSQGSITETINLFRAKLYKLLYLQTGDTSALDEGKQCLSTLTSSTDYDILLLRAEYEIFDGTFETLQNILAVHNQTAQFYQRVTLLCLQHFLRSKSPVWAMHAEFNLTYLWKMFPNNQFNILLREEIDLAISISKEIKENKIDILRKISPEISHTPYLYYIKGWQCIYLNNFQAASHYFEKAAAINQGSTCIDSLVASSICTWQDLIMDIPNVVTTFEKSKFQTPSLLSWLVIHKSTSDLPQDQVLPIFLGDYHLFEILEIVRKPTPIATKLDEIKKSSFNKSVLFSGVGNDNLNADDRLNLDFSVLLKLHDYDASIEQLQLMYRQYLTQIESSIPLKPLFADVYSLYSGIFPSQFEKCTDLHEQANRSSLNYLAHTKNYELILEYKNEIKIIEEHISKNELQQAKEKLIKFKSKEFPHSVATKLANLSTTIYSKLNNLNLAYEFITELYNGITITMYKQAIRYFLVRSTFNLKKYDLTIEHLKNVPKLNDEQIRMLLISYFHLKKIDEGLSEFNKRVTKDNFNDQVLVYKILFLLNSYREIPKSDIDLINQLLNKGISYLYAIKGLYLGLSSEPGNENAVNECLQKFECNEKVNAFYLAQAQLLILQENPDKTKLQESIQILNKISSKYQTHRNILLFIAYGKVGEFHKAEEVLKTIEYQRSPFVKLKAHCHAVHAAIMFSKGKIEEGAKLLQFAIDNNIHVRIALEAAFKAYFDAYITVQDDKIKFNDSTFSHARAYSILLESKFGDSSYRDQLNLCHTAVSNWIYLLKLNEQQHFDIDFLINSGFITNIFMFISFGGSEIVNGMINHLSNEYPNIKTKDIIDVLSNKETVQNFDSVRILKSIVFYYLNDSENARKELNQLIAKYPHEKFLKLFNFFVYHLEGDNSNAISCLQSLPYNFATTIKVFAKKALLALETNNPYVMSECKDFWYNSIVSSKLIFGNKLNADDLKLLTDSIEGNVDSFTKHSSSILYFMGLIRSDFHKEAYQFSKSYVPIERFANFYRRLRNELKVSLPVSLKSELALERGVISAKVEDGLIDEPHDVKPEDILVLFKSLPEKYFTESKRKNKVERQKLTERLAVLVDFLKRDAPEYPAVPKDPIERRAFYKKYRTYFLQALSLMKKADDATDRMSDFLISFAYDSYPSVWCATEGIRSARSGYEYIAGNQQDYSLEDLLYNALDSLKLSILTEIADVDAKASNHAQTNHLVSNYIAWLKSEQIAAIPMILYNDPFGAKYKTAHNPATLSISFSREFNFKKIKSFVKLKIEENNHFKNLAISNLCEIIENKLQNSNHPSLNTMEELVALKVEREKLDHLVDADVEKFIEISQRICELSKELNKDLSAPLPLSIVDSANAKEKMLERFNVFKDELGLSDNELSEIEHLELLDKRHKKALSDKSRQVSLLKKNLLESLLVHKGYVTEDDEGNFTVTELGVRKILIDAGIFLEPRKGKRFRGETVHTANKDRRIA